MREVLKCLQELLSIETSLVGARDGGVEYKRIEQIYPLSFL